MPYSPERGWPSFLTTSFKSVCYGFGTDIAFLQIVMKFLVVDDDRYIADLVSSVLKKNEVEVTSHFNVGDALRNLMDEEFDGIIVDLHMPGMDGFSAISLAREIRPHINVGLMTADKTPGLKEKSMTVGADFFLEKPLDIDNLWETIKKTLRRP